MLVEGNEYYVTSKVHPRVITIEEGIRRVKVLPEGCVGILLVWETEEAGRKFEGKDVMIERIVLTKEVKMYRQVTLWEIVCDGCGKTYDETISRYGKTREEAEEMIETDDWWKVKDGKVLCSWCY